ncbi:MAG: hypothetical protein WBA51_10240, partial [Erythrobacter sp.]
MSKNSPDERISNPKRDRGRYLSCWVSDGLFEQVVADAERAGLSRSDYIKQVLGGTPVPRKYRATNAATLELAKFAGRLGKLGSNANQIAKHINICIKSGQPESAPAAAELIALYRAIVDLLEDIQVGIHEARNGTLTSATPE